MTNLPGLARSIRQVLQTKPLGRVIFLDWTRNFCRCTTWRRKHGKNIWQTEKERNGEHSSISVRTRTRFNYDSFRRHVKKMCTIALFVQERFLSLYHKSTNSRFTVHNFNSSRNHVSYDLLYSYIIQLENLW